MDFWDHASWRLIPQNNQSADEPDFTATLLVQRVNPGVRLIVILRKPADRLYSSFLHSRFGRSADQFHYKVIADILNTCLATRTIRACLYDPLVIQKLPTVDFYVVHLRERLRVFPREQILVLRT
jgi:hypothetical protein